MNDSKHIAYSIMLFFAVAVLFRLGYAEIQPWDEGLYAMRAKSILTFGNFTDQTAHSPGGLYSSTPPPLTVWSIAGAMQLFGQRGFSVRLFSALCSIGSIFLMFSISTRFLNHEKSLGAALLLCSSLIWNQLSRQGMTDVPLMFFILLNLFFLIKVFESDKYGIIWGILAGAAFGAGLMTKMILSFIPLLFFMIFIIYAKKREKRFIASASLIFGLIIALPWHIFMFLKHGNPFLTTFFLPQLYSSVENNSGNNVFFYINQLIIANPFTVLAFPAVYLSFKRSYRWNNAGFLMNIIRQTCRIWFIAGLVIFSAAPTKLSHYTIYLLPPSIFLAVDFYSKLKKRDYSPKTIWFFMSALIIATIWSFGLELRQDIKMIFSSLKFTPFSALFLLIVSGLIALGIILKKETVKSLLTPTFSKLVSIFMVFFLLRIMAINFTGNFNTISGGFKTGQIVREVDGKSFIYLYHSHNDADSLNPQLDWYTSGWLSGWLKGKKYIPLPMPYSRISFKSVRQADLYPEQILVYYLSDNEYANITTAKLLLETRPLLEQSGRYLIFGKKRWSHSKGYEI